MKKTIFILIAILSIGFANAQKSSGAYLQVGTNVEKKEFTLVAEAGEYVGKHRIGVLAETYTSDRLFNANKRYWNTGVAYQFAQPLGAGIDVLLGAKGKVNLTGPSRNAYLEPGLGFGFNISKGLQFQAGASLPLSEHDDFEAHNVQGNFGLNFRF